MWPWIVVRTGTCTDKSLTIKAGMCIMNREYWLSREIESVLIWCWFSEFFNRMSLERKMKLWGASMHWSWAAETSLTQVQTEAVHPGNQVWHFPPIRRWLWMWDWLEDWWFLCHFYTPDTLEFVWQLGEKPSAELESQTNPAVIMKSTFTEHDG